MTENPANFSGTAGAARQATNQNAPMRFDSVLAFSLVTAPSGNRSFPYRVRLGVMLFVRPWTHHPSRRVEFSRNSSTVRVPTAAEFDYLCSSRAIFRFNNSILSFANLCQCTERTVHAVAEIDQ